MNHQKHAKTPFLLKKKNLALTGLGFFCGVLVSLTLQQAVAANTAGTIFPLDDLRLFSEIFGRIKQDYVEPVEDKKLIQEAIRGMITGLDPHSDYFNAESFKELTESTKGEFGGIGIELSSEDGLIKVVSPIEDTPAYQAGIKSGDLIVQIDDASVRKITINDAIKKMRGKPGTLVTLTISRKNETKPLIFKIKRALIQNKSVKARLLETNYGYVRIAQFQENTVQDFAQALNQLYKENKTPLQGLVLDLRDDPGGVLLGAVGVSSAFLPSDSLIVYTDGRANNAKAKFYAKPQDYVFRYTQASQDPIQNIPSEVKTVPLTVLVNAGSASASEIVAGALQDHKRAVLVGTQTFGKGLVQSVIPLANGAGMKLTTAHYYTPKGRSIQIKGITPDVIVEAGTLNTINELKRTREADLVGHLGNPQEPSNDSQETSRKKGNVNSTGTSSENQEGQSETKNLAKAVKDPNITDNQLNQALNILKAQQVLSQR